MKYFDHDTTASDDDKIMALRIECGGAAVDAYWCVLELIHRDETDLVISENQPKTKSLCHRLCVGFEQLQSWLQSMVSVGLLTAKKSDENDVDNSVSYASVRAAANIARYASKAETARQNGKKGGRKPKRNRTETKSVSEKNPGLTQPKTKEKKKVLVTHKGLPNTSASGGAAAAKAAPPAADDTVVPRCPSCGGVMRYDPKEQLWRCKDGACRATVKPHELSRCFTAEPQRDGPLPRCSLCDSHVKPPMIPGGFWDCPVCGPIKESAVSWR